MWWTRLVVFQSVLLLKLLFYIVLFEWQQNQIVARAATDRDVWPLNTCLGRHSSQFVKWWASFPCHCLDNFPHHLAKGGFCGRRRDEAATKPQLTTPQADVQLTAADTQLLAHHLLAHAAMPPSCNFATTGETALLSHCCLGRRWQSEPGDSTLTQSKGHLARSGQSGRTDTIDRYPSNFPASNIRKETMRTDMAKKIDVWIILLHSVLWILHNY